MPIKLSKQSSGIGSVVLPRELTANLEMDGLGWTIFLDRFSHFYESIQYQCYHDCHSCRLAFQQLRITRSGQRRLLSALILLHAPSKTNLLTRALKECIKDPGHVLDQLPLDRRGYGESRVMEQFVLKMIWVFFEDRVLYLEMMELSTS
uniref:Uncharacterized protein n=1 Tax=Salix viminalis TaxID=40686 RepID=A0A6N2MPI9_SALVM